jgi:MoxR-like ATPase
MSAIATVRNVHIAADVRHYVTALTRATRGHEAIALGASPRASLMLARAAQARAAMNGRGFVIPDDVKELAKPVLLHRLVLAPEARLRGRNLATVLDGVLAATPVPVEGTVGLQRAPGDGPP